MKTYKNQFVERVDNLLLNRNEKRQSLTDNLELTHSALSDWEKRVTIPSGDICLKIAKYFNVSVEWLITGKDTESEKKDQQPKDESIIKLLCELQTLPEEQKQKLLSIFNYSITTLKASLEQ